MRRPGRLERVDLGGGSVVGRPKRGGQLSIGAQGLVEVGGDVGVRWLAPLLQVFDVAFALRGKQGKRAVGKPSFVAKAAKRDAESVSGVPC